MNIKMDVDQFHRVLMLYLIDISQQTKGYLDDDDTVVFSPEFDEFIRHLQKRPLGKLRTAYTREDARTKLYYRRLKNDIMKAEDVRLML